MTGKLTENFLKGLEDVERLLRVLHFSPKGLHKKGVAYFVQYQRGETIIEFLFGPSDWDVEMIIYTSKGKFAFRDLLNIPSIAQWVNDHRYTQLHERDIHEELLWFVNLLTFSLPMIDDK